MSSSLITELRSIWQFRTLCRQLVLRELQSRYAGTAAGAIWLYAPPLLTTAAYYLLFDVVFNIRMGDSTARTLGAYLIVGMLPWMTFCDTVTRCMNSLTDAGPILQKNPLPPVLFVSRSALSSLIIFFPLLFFLWFFYGSYHNFSLQCLIGYIFFLTLLACLCWLIGYWLALLAAAARDVVQFVGFFLSIGVFVSPVLFPMDRFPAAWQWTLWINPITPFALAFQSLLLNGQFPPLHICLAAFTWIAVLALTLGPAIGRVRDELIDWL